MTNMLIDVFKYFLLCMSISYAQWGLCVGAIDEREAFNFNTINYDVNADEMHDADAIHRHIVHTVRLWIIWEKWAMLKTELIIIFACISPYDFEFLFHFVKISSNIK